MTDKKAPMAKVKSFPGSHMVDGRTYRNVPTTNNTEPQRPAYPAERKPAAGPVITTADVEPKKKAAEAEVDAKAKEKKGKK